VLDARLRSPPGAKLFAGLGAASASGGAAGAAAVDDVLIFAAAAAAAALPADDATWAGAALSGAVPVKSQAKEPAGAAAPAQGSAPTRVETASPATSAADPAGGPVKPTPKPDSPAAFQARRAALAARGVRIEEVAADDGFLDLRAVLQKLAELDVNEVLVEAGPALAGQLLTAFLVDELLLYIAPKLLGPQGRPLVNLPELQSLEDAWGFSLFDAKRFGDDLRLRLRPK
jgi:riboflavin biosynthesis pyrimidine reductase